SFRMRSGTILAFRSGDLWIASTTVVGHEASPHHIVTCRGVKNRSNPYPSLAPVGAALARGASPCNACRKWGALEGRYVFRRSRAAHVSVWIPGACAPGYLLPLLRSSGCCRTREMPQYGQGASPVGRDMHLLTAQQAPVRH